MLPANVIAQIKADLPLWQNNMSVLESSHRSDVFATLVERLQANLRKLLQVPNHYQILLLQGGARAQFSMVPLNLLTASKAASYLLTGFWSKLAWQDASAYGNMQVAATSEPQEFTLIPEPNSWQIASDASYLHYVDNESIHGVEFPFIPDVAVPLAVDMTSNILSRPVDFSKFAVVYASAQKNLGIAGATLVIVDPQYLQDSVANRPLLYDYKVAIAHNSMLNTPCIFAWYVMDLILQWKIAQGGIAALAAKNQRNADKLYACIDNSGSYHNKVAAKFRSRTNIPFTLADQNLEAKFLAAAEQRGLMQLKGHKVVGGMRASLYNAMPEEGVDALVEFMQEFARIYG